MQIAPLIVASETLTPIMELTDYTLDWADGDENDFQLETSRMLHAGQVIWMDGTPVGGIIDSVRTEYGARTITYKGRTWSGLLADRIISPPAGQDNLILSGDIASSTETILKQAGVLDGKPFTWTGTPTGVTRTVTVDRYCTCADALADLLTPAGWRLDVTHIQDRIQVRPVQAMTRTVSMQGQAQYAASMTATITPYPVNHLIGLGKGEGKAREIVHRYADTTGSISDKQTITGMLERAATYDASNKSGTELAQAVETKLKALQSFGDADIKVKDTTGLHTGDMLTVIDDAHHVTATARITKTVVKSDGMTITVDQSTETGPVKGA